MGPTIEFLMKQHEHVLQSIILADQKAAAITALSLGTIYILNELMKSPCFAASVWKWWGGIAQVLMLLSAGVALWAVHPPAFLADRGVTGGEHMIPARAVYLGQDAWVKWALSSSADDREKEVAALVYSRMVIRAWKYGWIQWSIWLMYAGSAMLLVLVVRRLRVVDTTPAPQTT